MKYSIFLSLLSCMFVIHESRADAEPDDLSPTEIRNSLTGVQQLTVAPGFKVETVYAVPLEQQGSWVALAVDDKGRLLASDQGDKGLFRITLPAPDASAGPLVEKMPVDFSGAQGMTWMAGGLYGFKSGEGIFRITDENDDGLLDKAELLSRVTGSGEHGDHALLPVGDGGLLYACAGNHTSLPEGSAIRRKRVQSWGEDLLLPRQWDARGHARGVLAPGGWVTLFDPADKTHDLYCTGFRNEYDVALNDCGDLFTFDADMEWDMGLPWYRPTRICHVVSGADYGWRSGSGKWPAYFEDSLPPVVNIGPGSPTGVVNGAGTRFPTRYQQAVFALDWTFGRILAIHLQPDGAGYRGEAEVFISGAPLPVTDAVVGADGALYFATGGRGARSSLIRVTYIGKESIEPPSPTQLPEDAIIRRRLEAYHGQQNPAAVDAAWPHLSSSDRFLRHAARVAIESQPVAAWAARVFDEPSSQARITAGVALARCGDGTHRAPLLRSLCDLEFERLPASQQLGVLRAAALACIRLGEPTDDERTALIAAFLPSLPSDNSDLNTELLRMLVYLDAPEAVSKGMQLIASRGPATAPDWGGVDALNAQYGASLQRMTQQPPPTTAIGYAFILRNARRGWTRDLRRQYFEFLNVAGKAAGGASYPGYLANTRDEVLAALSNEERLALQDVTGEDFNPVPDFPITPPQGPGQVWTKDAALAATTANRLRQANFESGRNLFHAVRCGVCHRLNGLGGGVGPDLTSVPNKFDIPYVLDAILEPSKVISDQYGSKLVLLASGRVLQGLVVDEDDGAIRVYPPDPLSNGEVVPRDQIEEISVSNVSQMPEGMLNALSAAELRDLVAYVMSGGDPNHQFYGRRPRRR